MVYAPSLYTARFSPSRDMWAHLFMRRAVFSIIHTEPADISTN